MNGCTRLKIQGVDQIFVKIPEGDQCFLGKISRGVNHFGCYCIFINKFFKTLPAGVLFHPLYNLPPQASKNKKLLKVEEVVYHYENASTPIRTAVCFGKTQN
jgi:hypothetical protein